MKKHLSVLMLYVRSTIYKFLLLMLAMAVAQSLLFMRAFLKADGFFGLNTIMGAARPGITFAACFLLLCALLCLTCCEFGSKQGYTLSRLRISQRMVFLWQAVANVGFVLLFWAAQIGIALAFCSFYAAYYPQGQAAMLVFYSNSFLHGLLPLEDTGLLIRNIVWLAGLAVASASFPVRMRRGEKPVAAIADALLCVLFFVREINSTTVNVLLSMAIIAISSYSVYGAHKEGADE